MLAVDRQRDIAYIDCLPIGQIGFSCGEDQVGGCVSDYSGFQLIGTAFRGHIHYTLCENDRCALPEHLQATQGR